MIPETALALEVTETVRIFKFAEGVDPAVGEPFEVVEQSRVLEGPEREEALKMYEEAKQNATN